MDGIRVDPAGQFSNRGVTEMSRTNAWLTYSSSTTRSWTGCLSRPLMTPLLMARGEVKSTGRRWSDTKTG